MHVWVCQYSDMPVCVYKCETEKREEEMKESINKKNS